jgi:hypothetical protein
MDDRERTQIIKAALHKQFPNCKFSVTRGGSCIEWTDDGPDVTEVEDAIIASGIVEIREGWDGKRWLRIESRSGNDICFDRYNVAERAAYQQDLARRIEEREVRAQRTKAAVAVVERTKRVAIDALRYSAPEIDTSQLEAANAAFEALRQRAEAAVAIENDERQRRPSWAPPLTLEGELLDLSRTLGYLAPDAPPIARLWAEFADPRKSRTVLRDRVGTLPLRGLEVRGFQLFAGSERGNTSDLLFEAPRTEEGSWRFGPRLYVPHYWSSREHEWTRLIRDRAAAEDRLARGEAYPNDQTLAENLTRQIAEIDAQDLAGADKQRKHSEQRTRAVQLAQHRVLEFVGAPDAQMQSAARLWGHCYIRGKTLTDPISLERGIGPDCLHARVEFIRRNREKPREWLAFRSELPLSFVTELLLETTQAAE